MNITITKEMLLEGVRGAFHGIDDEHLYNSIAIPLVTFNGAAAAVMQQHNLESRHLLSVLLTNPEHHDEAGVKLMRDVGGYLACVFLDLVEAQLQAIQDGKPPGPDSHKPTSTTA